MDAKTRQSIREGIAASRKSAELAKRVGGKSYRGTHHLNAVEYAEQLLEEVDHLKQELGYYRKDKQHSNDVLSPFFQSGGKYSGYLTIGESLVDGVPRLIADYEKLQARNQKEESIEKAQGSKEC